ncbi:P-loop containing nucleoside triphosphate hydrolase protein [Suillus variegatus]|nr:P-loop containing nucleoside triphosphate hydrolase protein [Suillus variegatus]
MSIHTPRKKARIRLDDDVSSVKTRPANTLQKQREQLPIATGYRSPSYILESGIAGKGMIAVTQPRRVAATSLAARVAEEKNVSLGGLVGYSVRFDEASSSDTRIKYVSDGMLAARNSAGDVSRKGKGPASALNPATLDAEKFSKFYNNARILYVKGRQHPQTDYVDAALRTFFQIHTDRPPGDVLIFLPGQEDIESLDKSIKMYARRLPEERMTVLTCPMYAALPPAQQARIFSSAPTNARKCILATNIAETSITIPGIKYVIDTGKCKEKRYLSKDTGGGFDTLLTRDITKSSAMQRAGRAGREGPGFCFRLYTEDAFNSMALSAEPEIRRCSLTQSVLQLKCLGQDFEAIDFMDPPEIGSVISALKTLWLLGALDNSKTLTTLGRQMASFPVEPYFARIILASKTHGCTSEVIDIVSLLSSSSALFLDISDQRDTISEVRVKFRHASGDHMTMLNALRSYQEVAASDSKGARKEWCRQHFVNERTFVEATKIRDQLRQTCQRVGIDWHASTADNEEPVLRCFVTGLVQQSAFLQPDGTYKQTMGHSVIKIHPGSTLCDKKVPAIIYDELVYTSQIYARGVSSVPKSFFSNVTPVAREA